MFMFRCPRFRDTKSQVKSINCSKYGITFIIERYRKSRMWMICNFLSSRKTLKDYHRRIVQMHCAWLLDTHWIRLLLVCKIHIIFGRRVVPSNGQCSLFWVPELHFRKVQTQRHVPMVSVVKRHVEAHSTRGLGVGRVGPGQRSFEFKHDAAYSLRYSLLCACTHFHISAAGNCIFREHPNLVSDYQISTKRW